MKINAITVTLNPAIDRTLTIPGFTAGKVNRVELACDNPGGKGINVASALTDCGYRVAAAGFLGNANAGLFEGFFAKKQITDRFIRVEGQTRIGLKIVDPVTQQTTDINFPGFSPAPANFKDLEECLAQLATMPPTWFALSGSLPAGTPVTLYRDLVAMLKEAGHPVLLDTSGEALRFALEARPTILKPNLHELEALLGNQLKSKAEILAAAQNLLIGGTEMVVVSMGEAGALFMTKNQCLTAIPPSISVKSTVGAGDAMVAGLIDAQIRNESLTDCACRATALSLHRLTCSASGLETPLEAQKWISQVAVSYE